MTSEPMCVTGFLVRADWGGWCESASLAARHREANLCKCWTVQPGPAVGSTLPHQ